MNKMLSISAVVLAIASTNVIAEEGGPSVSGSLSFDFNTHFISYGYDVWAPDGWNDLLFQPSAGLTFDSGAGWGFYTGVWADINDQLDSTIGGDIQEIDVWVGGYVTVEKFTFDLAYQQWYYAEETEGIVDFSVSYDHFLSPKLLIHGRIDGNGGQETGVVVDFGGSYGFDLEGVSFSVPLNIAFASDEFHGGDSGLAYVKTGLNFSIPLPLDEGWGSWDVHGGLTGWYTPDDVIPGNPDETFITGSLGVGVGF